MMNDTIECDDRPTVVPTDVHGLHRTGTLRDVDVEEISTVLGFPPNGGPSLDGKVKHEWMFQADGEPCGVWDYKGRFREYSTYGGQEVMTRLFGSKYQGFR